MKAENVRLLEFLERGQVLFNIPVYQRNYEWGNDQCKKLFSDLENNTNKENSHFLGTIVYTRDDGENMTNIYNIIDGQQRITSCFLLLKALAESNPNRKKEIEERFIFNKYININDHLRLASVSKDKEAFRMLMTNRMNEYLLPSKVINNFKLFATLIKKSKFDSNQLFNAMNNFDIVYISLDNDRGSENPQVVFESLNSTGVSLTASDLIRNFILMRLSNSKQTQLYNDYWAKIQEIFNSKLFTNFIRHYLMMKSGSMVKKSDVYTAYKNYFKSKNFTSEDALREMYIFANYYNNLLNGNNMPYEINKIIHNINVLDKTVVYPYFLMVIDKVNKEEFDWDEAKKLFYLVESYLFRRMICEIPSNGLNTIMLSLINYNNDVDMYSKLKQKLLNNAFPTDKEVRENIINNPIYSKGNKNRSWIKLMLTIIESNLTKETINFDESQIEHILPQKLSTDWRLNLPNAESINKKYGNTMGNLTLTNYNQEMSNKCFEDKKKYYKDSNILLTRNIPAEYNNWDKDSIIRRSNKIANYLINIFKRPKLNNTEAYADVYGEHQIEDDVIVTGLKIVKITINGKNYTTKTWISALIILLNYLWDQDSNNINLIKMNNSLNKELFHNIRRAKTLSNGENIESNLSATNILALMAKISEVCGITNEISYTVG